VLCDVADEDLAGFEAIKRVLQYEPRQVVFYEGHACLGLYLLCAGKVTLTRSSVRGHRHILPVLGPGEVIEKHAFQERAVHGATCETVESSQIAVIERAPYLALLERRPDLALKVIQLVSREIGRHLDHLDEFTFKTARERLAGVLIDLGRRFGKQAGGVVQVGVELKREEVAEMAGVTVETVIRLLGTFRKEGLVTLDGRTITLRNPNRLSRIAKL